MKPTDDMVEAASEAIYNFLDERFPGGALPGGQQIFADDHLDAEFKHEAGCDELATVALRAALSAALQGEMQPSEAMERISALVADAFDGTLGSAQALDAIDDVAQAYRAALRTAALRGDGPVAKEGKQR